MNSTPAPVAIRPMQPYDLEQILAIATASREAPQWTPAAFAAYLPSATDPPIFRTASVAEHNSRILAFAAATLLLDGDQNLCQLESIAVLPSNRRRGLATLLIRAILTWARESGAHHLSLEVRASNGAAIGLYRRLGLQEEGRRPGYYADPEEDALLLGTSVTPDSPCGKFPP
jgi:[ribosomal protein S18]-alanine N-acetyltransferase